MKHDPLCWIGKPNAPTDEKEWCDCEFIAKVRDDQTKRCIAKVEAFTEEMRDWSSSETLAAVKAAPQLTVEQWIWAQVGARKAAMVLRSLLEGESQPLSRSISGTGIETQPYQVDTKDRI